MTTTSTTRAHGTRACYVMNKCRRPECVEANRLYARERDHATRAPDKARVAVYIDATEVREHIIELGKAGIGYKRVAKLAGLSPTTLANVRTGRVKRVERRTAERVMAVPASAADGAYVDAAGAWRDVDALLAAGWTRVAIARALSGNPRTRALQLDRHRVTGAHARKLQALRAKYAPRERTVEEQRELNDEITALYEQLASIVEERNEQPWRARARCRTVPQSVFFPGRGASLDEARAVCARCPVIEECRAAAPGGNVSGVYAALSQRDRRGIEEAAPPPAPAPRVAEHGTRSRYAWPHRCRCEPCVEANRVYQRANRAKARQAELAS